MINRQCKALIEEYLGLFPCVAMIGPRQCGKTTLLQSFGSNWSYYDLEKRSDYHLLADDPDLFFRLNPGRIALDEAQLLPEIFPALRVAVDADRKSVGRFLLTGSSSPELLKSISESLAGRIGIIEMSPLTMEELTTGEAEFYQIFKEPEAFTTTINSLRERTSLTDIHKYWFAGGYPEPVTKNDDHFSELWMDQYVQTYIERDIARLFPSLNRPRFHQFTEMLAGLSGSVINYSEVARSLGVSQPTVRDYFTIAHGTFIWRHLYPYEKNVKKRIVKHPRGYFRDSGVLHHLLRIRDLRQLLSHPAMGFSWEGMVIEEILRGLHNRGITHDCSYYRTVSGAEVDLIIEGRFGTIPFEIKHQQNTSPGNIRGIRDFVREHQLPFGVVIDNGESIRRISESITAVPFSYCV